MRDDNIEPHLYWYNPNIHPFTEYKSRLDCLCEFASKENLEITVNDEYGLRSFLENVYSNEVSSQENRCIKCYKIRLEKTASFASQNGFSAFSTTLLISPYQNHDAIKSIAEEIAAKYEIDFFYRDFRPLFREGQNAARSNNFYMQKYCGCIFSEEERYLKKENKTIKKENKETVTTNLFFDRLTLLTGKEALKKLKNTYVLVFGAGGVGSWAAEALVRCGIGKIGIIDNDTICATNVNRQIEATSLTIGLPKASVLKKRLLEINPDCEVISWDKLFCLENADTFNIENADFVIDAIDTVQHKLDLIETVYKAGVTLFSSMGMALKTDPSYIKISSIWKTEYCNLAKVIRQGLRKRGFSGDFTVVFNDEKSQTKIIENQFEESNMDDNPARKKINGSIVTVTAAAGFFLANLVIQNILQDKK
ncbi:MAG: epoxyqueuosine reductase QueH [Treponema sp.]|nr:epoxyqueuosine reductase QueH [Treponema sp.]MCL2250318.1 epoxyqueuosine reductase QueH [Treponema sp.]